MLNKYAKAALVLLAMGSGTAFAASPVGQWRVTFYGEPGLSTGATQGICFKSNGTWYSTTFHDWNGDWFQKGDRLRWYGDTSGLGTAEFGQFVSNTSVSGEFAHWRAPGTPSVTSSRGNWYATKVSSSCSSPAAAALAAEGTDPSAK